MSAKNRYNTDVSTPWLASVTSASIATAILFSCLIGCTGCTLSLALGSKGQYGTWQTNKRAQENFEGRILLPDHVYYYQGSRTEPSSIIALHKDYTLQSTLWTRVEISQEMLETWMFWLGTEVDIFCPYRGGIIGTPDGQVAGVWYSRESRNTVIQPEPGILIIYEPFSLPFSACSREEFFDDL